MCDGILDSSNDSDQLRIFSIRNSSCGKVMFLRLSVILFARDVHDSSMHGAEGVWLAGAFVAGETLGCVLPATVAVSPATNAHGRGVCMEGGVHGRGCTWQGACVAGETATVAGGTHPTGMYSCLQWK